MTRVTTLQLTNLAKRGARILPLGEAFPKLLPKLERLIEAEIGRAPTQDEMYFACHEFRKARGERIKQEAKRRAQAQERLEDEHEAEHIRTLNLPQFVKTQALRRKKAIEALRYAEASIHEE